MKHCNRMGRPAPGAAAPPPSPDVVAYAARLRPLVEEALRARTGWLHALDEFDRRAALDELVDAAVHAAGSLGEIALALDAVGPPSACRHARGWPILRQRCGRSSPPPSGG